MANEVESSARTGNVLYMVVLSGYTDKGFSEHVSRSTLRTGRHVQGYDKLYLILSILKSCWAPLPAGMANARSIDLSNHSARTGSAHRVAILFYCVSHLQLL